MFRFTQHRLVAGALAFSVLCATFGFDAGSPPAAARSTAQPDTRSLECRAAGAARAARARSNDELEKLRQRCEEEVAAFEACRASRPAWRGVELFSCGFDISTSLARGDVEDPASLEDCGTPPVQASDANCPVPACEADLERLEEELALEEERC